jgi:hypothetical protein
VGERVLHDGRKSRGFFAVEVELPEAPISNEALGVLIRIRGLADRDETDGLVSDRSLRALAAFHGWNARRLGTILGELEAAGLLIRTTEGVLDRNFGAYCQTREQREAQRETWRRKKRPQLHNPPTSQGESPRESRGDSHVSHAQAPSQAPQEDPEPDRLDVLQVCHRLADSIAEWDRRPTVSTAWKREARLMLDRDERPLREALDIIEHLSCDDFWRPNILSMAKLRKHYPKLKERIRRPAGQQTPQGRAGAVDDRVARLMGKPSLGDLYRQEADRLRPSAFTATDADEPQPLVLPPAAS